MSPEISCLKKNGGNGNGQISPETLKPKAQNLPKEVSWCIRQDMPKPSKKESFKKP